LVVHGVSVRGVELIDAASAEFERVVRQLPSDSWDRPTPSQMSVRKLVEHVVVGNYFTALVLAGVDRDEARSMLTRDLLGHDPVVAVVESARRQAQAFAAAPAGQLVPGPKGDISAAAYLRFRVVDLVVHAWDLLRAAGLDEALDPRVVAELMDMAERNRTWTTCSPTGRMAQVRAAHCLLRSHRRIGCSIGSGAGPSITIAGD
jgi:uncharacterized protein (TIGR03086 family)